MIQTREADSKVRPSLLKHVNVLGLKNDDMTKRPHSMEELLTRVGAVAHATGKGDDHQLITDGEEPDEFTLLKRRINLDIRELRNLIHDRDEYASSRGTQGGKAEIVRQSAVIRARLEEIRQAAERLRHTVICEDQRLRSKGTSADGLANRFEMCDLVEAHIEECDRWFKGLQFANVDGPKCFLLKGATLPQVEMVQTVDFVPQDATQSELTDINGMEEWRMQIRENEAEIDEKLDLVLHGTNQIRAVATTLAEAYQDLGIMVSEVDHEMDHTREALDTGNVQLVEVKAGLAVKSNFCIDVTLVLVLLAIIGFGIWKYAM
jgi:hypothetical protein